MTPAQGRAFVFGDNIDTDLLAPGSLMKLPPEELAKHCLAAIDPDFAKSVRPGDVLVAGLNFGLGSSREQAAISLKLLGLSTVIAVSFARIFYRNAINIGLTAIVSPAAKDIAAGDQLSVDAIAGRIDNLTQGKRYSVEPIPAHLMSIIEAGGLMPYLSKRFSKTTREARP